MGFGRDSETDQYNRVVKGTVLFHSAARDETDAYFLAQRDSPIYSWASFYVGDMPEGVKVLL